MALVKVNGFMKKTNRQLGNVVDFECDYEQISIGAAANSRRETLE